MAAELNCEGPSSTRSSRRLLKDAFYNHLMTHLLSWGTATTKESARASPNPLSQRSNSTKSGVPVENERIPVERRLTFSTQVSESEVRINPLILEVKDACSESCASAF